MSGRIHAVPTAGSYFWDFINTRVPSFSYNSTLGSQTEEIAKLWIKAQAA